MRLDVYLESKHQEYSRSKLKDLIKRGLVTVDGVTVTKAGFSIKEDSIILLEDKELYVSRAGEKLAHIVDTINLNFNDLTIIDVGASTGGFTDLSLKRGAKLVYAYDVGKNQLDINLRNNPKVKSFEETNILDVTLPEHDLTLVDVSFTSIFPILDHLKNQTKRIIFLLKPQFETGGKGLKKGILKNDKIQREVIAKTTNYLKKNDFQIKGFVKSPISGKSGNEEFLFYCTRE